MEESVKSLSSPKVLPRKLTEGSELASVLGRLAQPCSGSQAPSHCLDISLCALHPLQPNPTSSFDLFKGIDAIVILGGPRAVESFHFVKGTDKQVGSTAVSRFSLPPALVLVCDLDRRLSSACGLRLSAG